MEYKKLVILTAGGLNGRRLAHLFTKNNISYELLTVSFPLPKKKGKTSFNYYKIYIRGVLANIKIFRQIGMRHLPKYPVKEQFIGRQNGRKMLKRLQQISPDYIFMMGGGILKDYIINTANIGVLNAHPGILPYIRGVDAIKHSILKDIPIGVTGHFIDPGIDTGAMIERYWLPISKNDTFANVLEYSDHLSVAVMAKMAFDIVQGKDITKIFQRKKCKLCKSLDAKRAIQGLEKFNNGWYITHQDNIQKIDGLKSGQELLEKYNSWWPLSERF